MLSQGSRLQPAWVVVRRVDLESLSFQEPRQEVYKGSVIVHNKQAVHGIYCALSRNGLQ